MKEIDWKHSSSTISNWWLCQFHHHDICAIWLNDYHLVIRIISSTPLLGWEGKRCIIERKTLWWRWRRKNNFSGNGLVLTPQSGHQWKEIAKPSFLAIKSGEHHFLAALAALNLPMGLSYSLIHHSSFRAIGPITSNFLTQADWRLYGIR